MPKTMNEKTGRKLLNKPAKELLKQAERFVHPNTKQVGCLFYIDRYGKEVKNVYADVVERDKLKEIIGRFCKAMVDQGSAYTVKGAHITENPENLQTPFSRLWEVVPYTKYDEANYHARLILVPLRADSEATKDISKYYKNDKIWLIHYLKCFHDSFVYGNDQHLFQQKCAFKNKNTEIFALPPAVTFKTGTYFMKKGRDSKPIIFRNANKERMSKYFSKILIHHTNEFKPLHVDYLDQSIYVINYYDDQHPYIKTEKITYWVDMIEDMQQELLQHFGISSPVYGAYWRVVAFDNGLDETTTIYDSFYGPSQRVYNFPVVVDQLFQYFISPIPDNMAEQIVSYYGYGSKIIDLANY